MYCPKCGAPNADGARFCEKCGAGMTEAAPVPVQATGYGPPPAQAMVPLQQWQAPPPYAHVAVHGDPRVRGSQAVVAWGAGGRYAVGKDPTVAVLLALFVPIPGIAQFYNGDAKKGLLIFAGSVVGWLTSWIAGVGLVLVSGLYLWGAIDGYRVACGKAPLW